MGVLHTEDEEWLLDELARLVAARGPEPLLAFPLLEPTPRFFPDPFDGEVRGARLIADRLLKCARLDLQAEVHIDKTQGPHGDRAAWFAGINLGRAVFGVYQEHLRDPDALVGALCHEVAHAYRARHGLAGEDRDDEELRTDLTTVFLGFGVLTTNAAYRYRQGGEQRGTMAVTHWRHARFGYLPAPAMSFLLAAHSVARGATGTEVRRIAKLLEANQASWFRGACRQLRDADLRQRLGLPRETPAPRALPELTPIEDHRPVELADVLARPESALPLQKAGRIGFRVLRRQSFGFAEVFLGAYLLVGFVIAILVRGAHRAPITWGLRLFLLGAVVAAACGFAYGYRVRDDRCADCNAHLAVDATSCPGCGAELRGTLKSRDDRLAALEELEAKNPASGLPSRD